jgi:hypothetical protein
VSFATITLCVASHQVFIVDFVMTQSGNFWIHLRILRNLLFMLASLPRFSYFLFFVLSVLLLSLAFSHGLVLALLFLPTFLKLRCCIHNHHRPQ